jgi:tRNA A58 N-methylase Trm61
VWSYETRPEFFAIAKRNIELWGNASNVKLHSGEFFSSILELKNRTADLGEVELAHDYFDGVVLV